MADDKAAKPATKGGKGGLIVGLVLMLLCGGGGFYAVWSGLIPTGGGDAAETGHAAPAAGDHAAADAHAAPADAHGDSHGGGHGGGGDDGHEAGGGGVDGPFVALTPILVTVGGGETQRHLQFGAQLEVAPGAGAEVAALMPRAVDVLTTYLRAVSPADVDDPAAMLRMRAQMLRRIQVVMGEGKVRDLLVSEFVMR
jgi:flagellar FliL protein